MATEILKIYKIFIDNFFQNGYFTNRQIMKG